MELNNDKTEVELSIINTMLEMEDPNFYLNVYEIQTSDPKYWE